jgi:hypothetical protein
MQVLGIYAEAAEAGVSAVVVSVPACARASVERQTIPAMEVVAAGASKPTLRKVQA